jgi:hypothetical protein
MAVVAYLAQREHAHSDASLTNSGTADVRGIHNANALNPTPCRTACKLTATTTIDTTPVRSRCAVGSKLGQCESSY